MGPPMPRFMRFVALFSGVILSATLLPASLRAGGYSPPEQQAAKPKKSPKEAPPNNAARKALDANEELERAVDAAGNDRRALVGNLRSYLERYPDAPRREQVYRALVEASLQLGDTSTALEYAERLIALRPEDPSMMLLAVDLLERIGDDASNTRAAGYITRVIDRIEKATDQDRPASLTPQEWLDEQKKLLMSLYLIRGRLEVRRRRYDEAKADLEKSYALLPNPGAALRLGEIAEIRGQYERAIASYLTAFTLPEDYGVAVDRRQLRQKLGNVWRLVHGSEEGLGAKILESHDQHWAKPANAPTEQRNAQAKELGAFVVRRLAGEELQLETLKGKVIVLSFWATWCPPCVEVERLLGRVAGTYRDDAGVAFLSVNCDENETLARVFVENQKLGGQIVFDDGLRTFFSVGVLPTVIVLDRAGQIAYRGEGFSPANLEKEVRAAIESHAASPARPQ